MRWIDRKIIDQIERLCHWFQRMTGKTNFWLARWAILGIAFYFLISVFTNYAKDPPLWVDYVTDINEKLGSVDVFFAMIYVPVMVFYASTGWKWEEERAFERLRLGVANPEKINLVWVISRLLFLDFCISHILFIIFSNHYFHIAHFHLRAIEFFFPCWIYLKACDPLPPCSSKIMEMIRSLSFKPASQGI